MSRPTTMLRLSFSMPKMALGGMGRAVYPDAAPTSPANDSSSVPGARRAVSRLLQEDATEDVAEDEEHDNHERHDRRDEPDHGQKARPLVRGSRWAGGFAAGRALGAGGPLASRRRLCARGALAPAAPAAGPLGAHSDEAGAPGTRTRSPSRCREPVTRTTPSGPASSRARATTWRGSSTVSVSNPGTSWPASEARV